MKFLFTVIFLSLVGCASGHCNKDGNVRNENKFTKIAVYKYDGSKQCEEDTGTSLEDMAKELVGIKIISMIKKNDGQLRIQVCGALTGLANVYEISSKDLPKAEALGFKKWNF